MGQCCRPAGQEMLHSGRSEVDTARGEESCRPQKIVTSTKSGTPGNPGRATPSTQNHRVLPSSDPSTYSQCGSDMPRCISAPSSACLMHDGCGCAARARRRAECIVPSTASPLLAGSWAPPCHRCPTKVCIAGRTGEEQPVLPLWDACHSNYLRSEPLLRRHLSTACLGGISLCDLSDVGPALRF